MKNNILKVYISGAVSGTADYMQRFEEAEEFLKQEFPDAAIINPTKITALLPEDATIWQEYMDITLNVLRRCDVVYMLSGWKKSIGARIERLYAEGSGMTVMYQSNDD